MFGLNFITKLCVFCLKFMVFSLYICCFLLTFFVLSFFVFEPLIFVQFKIELCELWQIRDKISMDFIFLLESICSSKHYQKVLLCII